MVSCLTLSAAPDKSPAHEQKIFITFIFYRCLAPSIPAANDRRHFARRVRSALYPRRTDPGGFGQRRTSTRIRQTCAARFARPSDHAGRVQPAHRARTTVDGRSQVAGGRRILNAAAKIRRIVPGARNLSLLLHWRALVAQRAPARFGHPARRRFTPGRKTKARPNSPHKR